MIKKLLLAALFIITAGVISSYAQCTPDISCIPNGTDFGLCPDSTTGIPSGTVGIAYSQTLSVKVPGTAASFGFPLATIDSLVITAIDSLAPGLTYQCLGGHRSFPGGTNGCILISGTPTQVWNHRITIHFLPYVYYFIHNVGAPVNNRYYRSVILAPAPILTSTLTPLPICSGSAFHYSPTSGTSGAAFAWTRAAVSGISNISGSGTNDPNEILVNTTALPINVTYVYIVSASGAPNSIPYNVVVTVNPAPVLTSSLSPSGICSGLSFNYVPTSTISGTTFSWSRAAVSGISNLSGTGLGDPAEIVTNTTIAPINVTYIYSLTANGCTNSTTFSVVVSVIPCACNQSLSSSLTPPAICSGSVFSYIPTSVTPNTTFAWARPAVSGISNAAGSGTDDPNEILINTSPNPVSVTYVYTLTANGCTTPTPFSVVVVVNPIPTLSSLLTPAAICSGTVFHYTPASTTAGATFAWARASVAGISNIAGIGANDPSEILNNTTTAPVSVTYVYTLTANGCANPTTYSVVVVVNPIPALSSSSAPPSICSGTAFNYNPASATAGSAFAWVRASVAGISNIAGSGTDNPNEILTNTTANSINVTYVYTLTANGCSNPTTFNVVVSVTLCSCTQSLSSSLTPPPICSGTVFNYTPTSSTAGTTFAWTRAAVSGISNIGGSGNGDPNEILINTTTGTINVTYVYTLTASGCTNPATFNVVTAVNAMPVLTSTLSPAGICSGTAFNYIPTSTTAGTTFSWTRAVVAGISNIAGVGTGDPNETLTNTTANAVNVTYIYSITANGCINPTTFSVVVLVTPCACTQSLSSSLTPPAICSGTAFNYIPTSTTAGTTFSWTRAVMAGISNIAGVGTGDPNETLTNTTANAVNVTYIYTLTANGCTNPITFSVVVSVTPCACNQSLSSSLAPPAMCSGTAFNYIPTSSTAGTTFAWTRAAVAGISNIAGAGTGNPNEILTNTTANAVNVTYIYTLTANGCTNPITFSVVVSVTPCACNQSLSSSLAPPAICSGAAFNYIPTSSTAGTTFAWTRAAVAGISNIAGAGTGNPNETLTNTTANAVNVIYVYTLIANGCTNPTTFSVVVSVGICSGIAENSFSQNVTVYPNPTNGIFKIAIANAPLGDLLISLTDIQGKEVYNISEKNSSPDYIKEINLKNLAKGTYSIKLSSGTNVKIQKLIIQ